MAEYIEREDLIRRLELSIKSWGRDCNSNALAMVRAYRDILHRVKNLPAADVVEARHASWRWGYGLGGQYGIWCTNCGAGWPDSPNAEWIALEHDYCGKCSAKMDGNL